jgi:Cd2+/Zn2+-exporting ATPase
MPTVIAAMLILGTPTALKAFESFLQKRLSIHALVIVAVAGALCLGKFGEAVTVLFLFAIAELLEELSEQRARDAIRELMKITPNEATVEKDGRQVRVKVEDLKVNDVVLVKEGERIPIDGVIIWGKALVNQAPVTGEQQPLLKTVGSTVFAGSISVDGTIKVKATHTAHESTIARIARLIEQAETRKAPTERFINTFSRYYTPSVILLAVLMAIVPPMFFGGAFKDWFYRTLVVLLISCPCALVISAPMTIVCALIQAARNGVLIKGGIYIEQLASVKGIAFDKTGTLTTGEIEVDSVIPLNEHSEEEVLSVAASLESMSTHPLAKAIVKEAEKRSLKLMPVKDIEVEIGLGISGTLNETRYFVGNADFLKGSGMPVGEALDALEEMHLEGKSLVFVGEKGHICGVIVLADKLRENAKNVIEHLKNHCKKHVIMLTGDSMATARSVATKLGISELYAELLPEDKVRKIEELIDKHGSIAMVGDGVNDAPALAMANVGIAVGGAGTDIALEASHITLMNDELDKIPFAIHLSMRAMRIMRFNIAFSLTVKAIFLALAAVGMANLWMAIAADMGTSLTVLANSMNLLKD